jgi:hypothetical protein
MNNQGVAGTKNRDNPSTSHEDSFYPVLVAGEAIYLYRKLTKNNT